MILKRIRVFASRVNGVSQIEIKIEFLNRRYHTGSLAFGSLIIALIQLARAALEYLDHKLNGKFKLFNAFIQDIV